MKLTKSSGTWPRSLYQLELLALLLRDGTTEFVLAYQCL